MEKEQNGTHEVRIRELNKLQLDFNKLAILAVAGMLVVIVFLYIKWQGAESRAKQEVYVTVDDKIYNAIPIQKQRLVEDYEAFGELYGYNAFSHDFNSYDERMKILEPLSARPVLDYIMKSFEHKGLTLKEYYKKYDARSYFSVDSTRAEMGVGGGDILVYGKQRVVFSIGDPVSGDLCFQLKVTEVPRSNKNKAGLYVENFIYINR